MASLGLQDQIAVMVGFVETTALFVVEVVVVEASTSLLLSLNSPITQSFTPVVEVGLVTEVGLDLVAVSKYATVI
jgi:hypothetical protein